MNPRMPEFLLDIRDLIYGGKKKVLLIFMPPRRRVLGHINLPLSIHPDIDTWFVRLSPPTVLELQL